MKKYLLLLFFSCNNMAGELASSFEEAKQIAEQTEAVAAYKKFQSDVLLPYFGKKYSQVLQNCFESVNTPDDSAFEIIVAISSTGSVGKVYRNRETNIGLCMMDELAQDTFPRPIIAPFYIHIVMSFTG